ncbi:hypothetical protein niasHT_016559 [Heterodera trifolii]|uniref:Uncharacterized protein n=1 Tax=Heterodera trifolii TaxID=157864 RepID=A0ABD2LK98_9BILA
MFPQRCAVREKKHPRDLGERQLQSESNRLEKLVETLIKGENRNGNRFGDPHFSSSTSSAPITNNGTQLQWGQPPPFAGTSVVSRMITEAIINSEQLKEKAKRAVIEKLPEAMDERALVEQIAEECGIKDKLSPDIHRHPRTQPEGGVKRDRILKVPFLDKFSRDKFLFNFRNALKKFPNLPQFIKVRRDMTQSELKILYSLRQQAYQANIAAGEYKYFVVDLEIKSLKNPRPLRTR